jgi:5'-3' exonuclease
MDVYLLDGTYELFRYFFALPSHVTKEGREVGATRGVLGTVLSMLEGGVTHIGVATDHVIESFRNDMWPGYKTSAGMDPRILAQFPLIEEGLAAMGVTVWPMVELEADDALGAAAVQAAALSEVKRVFICSPDKDLGQCVRNGSILQLERRTGRVFDEAAVVAKFGVGPDSIPDYLALVGDSADGYPGLPGWGARSAATVLARFGSLDAIPDDVTAWGLPLRGERCAQTLRCSARLKSWSGASLLLISSRSARKPRRLSSWSGRCSVRSASVISSVLCYSVTRLELQPLLP